MSDNRELERIRQVYEGRKKTVPTGRYSFFDPANSYIVHRRDRAVLEALKRQGMAPLEDRKILDVGCGDGSELRNLLRYGARPGNLFGMDLLSDRIEAAREISPNIDFRCGSAEGLPYENGLFDIVMQFTVFTSILDGAMKNRIAAEMMRVLKPAGIVLWYDYHMDNPKNPDVRGIGKKEIGGLFPNCDIRLERVTLAPPLARLVAPRSFLACYLLEKIPLLRTHYLGVIKKPGETGKQENIGE